MKHKIWKIVGLLSIIIFMLSIAASAHAATLITIIPSPTIDQTSVAYSPNGYIFVSGYTGDDIEVIPDSSNTMVANLVVSLGAPYGLAYDSNKGVIWVATTGGATAISDSPPFQDVANVTDPNGFEFAAFDPQTSEVFMCYTEYMPVISDSTNSVIANVTYAGALFYSQWYVDDSTKSEIFAIGTGTSAGTSSTDVYVISAKTNEVTDAVSVGGDPEYIAYDSGLGEIFIGNAVLSSITGAATSYYLQVISDSKNQVIKTINLPSPVTTGPMAYNPNKGEIYISDATSVAIISDKTNNYIGSVNTNGTSGAALAYDSGTSTVYVINNAGSATGTYGSVAVISDPSSSSSSSSPTSTPTTSTTSPTSTPKVPEFSSSALALVTVALAAATLCAVAFAKKKKHPKT